MGAAGALRGPVVPPESQQELHPRGGNCYSLPWDDSTLFSELSLNPHPIHTLSTLLEGANIQIPMGISLQLPHGSQELPSNPTQAAQAVLCCSHLEPDNFLLPLLQESLPFPGLGLSSLQLLPPLLFLFFPKSFLPATGKGKENKMIDHTLWGGMLVRHIIPWDEKQSQNKWEGAAQPGWRARAELSMGME